MKLKNLCTGIIFLLCLPLIVEAVPYDIKKGKTINQTDSIKLSTNYLKKYLQQNNVWHVDNPEILGTLKGLVNFAENERIDNILTKLDNYHQTNGFKYINRSAYFVADSLQLPGYQPYTTILEKMKQLDRAIWNGVDMNSIPLPENLIAGPDGKILPIAHGDEEAIIRRAMPVLPDSLKNVSSIPNEQSGNANNFERIKERQKIRSAMLEAARQRFNSRAEKINLDSAVTAYKQYAVRVFSDSLQNQLKDSLQTKNFNLLTHYNDSVVRMVNDSINLFVKTLQRYALNDSVQVTIQSLSGSQSHLWLKNNQRSSNRMFIQNIQNDSIGIQLMNIDKRTIGIAIEDNVTFNRISEQRQRDHEFQKITPDKKLTQLQKQYDIVAPWELGGSSTFGFTQTYLNNWKAGGRSAFSILSVLKGYANYSGNKMKWENSGELRNGWIRQGGDVNQTQKNDDKIELISRLGVNAINKWYYSTEIDFVTQFFNGYNYPDKKNPISTYMSPAKTIFKLGLDYKPHKDFSLFISPITAKYVFVRDTALIDASRFGIARNSRSLWEPGINTDVRYRFNVNKQISIETKYKMFMNYQEPFKKVDLNWENTLNAQLTDRINMTVMLYLLYDDNVTFPTNKTDDKGNIIFKPKWQTKELMTIGFTYKLHKSVYKRKKLD